MQVEPIEINNCHMRLSFLEANILKLCMKRHGEDKTTLISRLSNLAEHTEDPLLLQEIFSLNEKILELTDEEFEKLRADALDGTILFPPNYTMPPL